MIVRSAGMRKLASIFRAELNLFLASRRIGPVSEVEDRRAGILALIAAFAPEALDRRSRERLFAERSRIRTEPDFSTLGWWRVAYLDAACYLLSRDVRYLGVLVGNLSHGNSSIRSGLIAPMGLCIPEVDPLAIDFVRPIGALITSGSFCADAALCLFLASRIDRHEKRLMMQGWLDAGPPGQVRDFLDRALDFGYAQNDLMVEEYNGLLAHFVALALEVHAEESHSPADASIDFSHRVGMHPLFRSLVRIEKV